MLVRQGSQYHFRRVVPARLRSVVGRGEVWASLGTTDRQIARARACSLYGCVEDWLVAAARVVDLEAEVAMLETACAAEEADIAAVHAQAAELQAKVDDARMLMSEAEHLQAASARLASLNTKFASLDVSRRAGPGSPGGCWSPVGTRSGALTWWSGWPRPRPLLHRPLMSRLLCPACVNAYFKHREQVAEATHQVMGPGPGHSDEVYRGLRRPPSERLWSRRRHPLPGRPKEASRHSWQVDRGPGRHCGRPYRQGRNGQGVLGCPRRLSSATAQQWPRSSSIASTRGMSPCPTTATHGMDTASALRPWLPATSGMPGRQTS